MIKFKPIPAEVSQHLRIDETSPTGLRWKDTSHCKNRVVEPGDIAGSWDDKSTPAYYKITFKGKTYKAHRIIWFLHTGNDPETFKVDHKDQNRRNNTIGNLRLVSNKQSADNRGIWGKVDYRGVSWHKGSSCYVSVFRDNNVHENLGLYETAEDAALVWDHKALQSNNSYKLLNFPEATSHEREQALKRRVRQRGTFLNGKKLIGVSYDKERNSFQAYVRVPNPNGSEKMVALGRYDTAYEAAKVRDLEVVRLGLNRKLNFPDNME